MGLEQRAGHIAPQEFNLSQRKEAVFVPAAQEVFRSEEKKFEGEQPAEDLRRIVKEERNAMSPDGFEPFEPSEDQVNFVNAYRGNFSKEMKLNRKAVERVLTIAHLDGTVSLTSLDNSRKRSIEEVNPDGSVSARRGLFKKQKIEDEEKEPLSRVISTPQGWNIEINGQKMAEQLTKKGLYGKGLQAKFIENFNRLLNTSVFEAVRREKLSGVKHKYIRRKLFLTLFPPLIQLLPRLLLNQDMITTIAYVLPFTFFTYGLMNFSQMERHSILSREIDHPLEWLMPNLEVDKVARTFAYLQGKGRKLVR